MGKRTTGRIEITTNVPDGVALAELVYAKHQADGAASPLNNLDEVDWAVTGPKLKPCRQEHDLAEQLKQVVITLEQGVIASERRYRRMSVLVWISTASALLAIGLLLSRN